ncbi:hypothetical protein HUG10_06365 [Halorarum halophilum]|uniref:Polyketide cyclase / dehydrase and lipid transport n=1 Tax=Halorarum halophilum TaxID=2743090 RepID=A0A7D5GB53_9EURY|nr:hypothetical protein [Halobaculum halophilum]QLG27186.1 hypothetical protein HUG10_06365 [Halobaculum halophilum]
MDGWKLWPEGYFPNSMKYTMETGIDAPIEEVAALVGETTNRIGWMEGIVSQEHVSGSPGMPGAKDQLVFEMNGNTIELTATVTERDLSDEFRQTMEAPQVLMAISTRLTPVTAERTKYVWD